MLLVYPPISRSSEPPPGITRLAGALRAVGQPVRCLDLNRAAFDWLFDLDPAASDTWTTGALSRKKRELASLRDPSGYTSFDRYQRSVLDLSRVLKAVSLDPACTGLRTSASAQEGSTSRYLVTLTDYQDKVLSPLRSADLRKSALDWQENLFSPFFTKRLAAELESHPQDEVGISLIYVSQALTAFAIAGWLRQIRPELRIVMGGGLVTSWMSQSLPGLEEAAAGIVDAFLPGEGETHYAAGYATPSFEDFDLPSYFSAGITLPFSFTTGCPWRRCSFCPEKAEASPFRGIRPADAAAQLQELSARWKPALYHFCDNEIAPGYLSMLAATPPGAPWYGFARFSKELADPAFCQALADSGCAMLQLGLESGDQGVLDALGKGTEIGTIDRILHNLRDAGIGVYLYVLFGTPAENRDSALVTRDFLESRAPLIHCINAAIFNMPIAGEEARSLLSPRFYEGDLSLYCEFEHPTGWDRLQVRRFLRKDFGASPGIRKILTRTPPAFTSNHAAFFLENYRAKMRGPRGKGEGRHT